MRKITLAALSLLHLWTLPTSAFVAPDLPKPGKQIIENLSVFSKIYGYVRYFYPGDEATQIDWDRFAVYGAQKIATIDKAHLKKTLEELFLPIAPAMKIHETGDKTVFSVESITPPDPSGMKVVAWQHLGAGYGTVKSSYRSIRLNRPKEIKIQGKPAILTQSFRTEGIRGKEFKLKATVKVKNGSGQLWLRVDRTNGKMGFFDNMRDRPLKSAEWSTLEIRGQVAHDAVKICFGALLYGRGQLWLDDFQFLVKKDSIWKPTEMIQNSSFEENLPGHAPGKWIRASRGFTYRTTADTATEGKQCLLINGDVNSLDIARPLFQEHPALGDHISKDLGGGLSIQMPIALFGTPTATYPATPGEKFRQFIREMESQLPTKYTGSNRYVRLADVVITWNVFQHFYPYFGQVRTDWRTALTTALSSAYTDGNAADFHDTLQLLIARLKDGSGNVFFWTHKTAPHCLPINWGRIENSLVITAVWDMNRRDIRPGDIVMEIDGVNAITALEKKALAISAATPGWKNYRSLTELLTGPKNSQVTIKIRQKGRTRTITLVRSMERGQHFRWRRGRKVSFKEIESGIYYLNLDVISMEDIEKLLPELEKAKSIICDLRGFPNRNSSFLSHLLTQTDTRKWMYIPQIIYPDYEKVTFSARGWHLEPKKPHLKAKIVFITDGSTIGYAESVMGYIEGYRLATIVGEPTAGTNGNINRFNLPGGYRITWTGMKVLKHDGSPHHGVGITPDIPVKRTIKGVRAGRDEFLEKAVQIARK